MFEYGPNGERRLSKFGQRVLFAMAMVFMVLVVTMWLVSHQRPGDNATAIVGGGFALAGSLGMGVLTWGQGRRNEDILNYQNEKLEQIQGKVEVRESETIAAIRESYQTALNAQADNSAREARVRHKLEGRNSALEAAVKHAEDELKAALIEKAKCETEARELRERLILLTSAVKGDKGDKGDRVADGDNADEVTP